ncbi:MAG: hypothetical protein JNK57_06795 [Planctomycetaceae bacterium]|nr:hypothetical protein [Planctomycetaceae bacterium]
MTSREQSSTELFKDPAWQWRRLGLWSVIPGIWLCVWLLAVALYAEENATRTSTDIIRLGWLPSLIASVMTSLYLANRTGILHQVDSWRVNLGWVSIAALFVSTQVYLGGWANGFVAGLILVAGEVQRQMTVGPMPLNVHVDRIPNTPVQTNSRDREGSHRTEPVAAPLISDVGKGEQPSGPFPTPVQEPDPPTGAVTGSQLEPSDVDAPDERMSHEWSEEPDDIESEEESAAPLASWIQQMTRTVCEAPDVQPTAADSGLGEPRNHERVEWFCRHHWQPTEVLVDLHVVFQPAFREKPSLRVEVVEGSGSVAIGDGQAYGARLQLKRLSPSDGDDYAVVWLEAIGLA